MHNIWFERAGVDSSSALVLNPLVLVQDSKDEIENCIFSPVLVRGSFIRVPYLFRGLIEHHLRCKSNSGGGGERVLWCALHALSTLASLRGAEVIVYTGDVDASPGEILSKAQVRLQICVIFALTAVLEPFRNSISSRLFNSVCVSSNKTSA